MSDPTTHLRSGESVSGLAIGAVVVTAGFFFSAPLLFPQSRVYLPVAPRTDPLLPRTDQSGQYGFYLPNEAPPPSVAKPDFGASLTPDLGVTLATVALLKEEFPGFAHGAMAEIQPVPQQLVVPVASTPEVPPLNFTPVGQLYAPSSAGGGGGGLIPTSATSVPTPATSVPTPATSVPRPATSVPTPATSVPTPATSVPTPATSVPTPATRVPSLEIPPLAVPSLKIPPSAKPDTQTGSTATAQTGSPNGGVSQGASNVGSQGASSQGVSQGSQGVSHGSQGVSHGSKGASQGSQGAGHK
jgi:hypothetical protein